MKKQNSYTCMAACLFSLLAASVLSGCATPMGIAASNVPVNPDQIEEQLGRAEGTSGKWSFSPLCLFSTGHADFDEAIDAALKASKGDALIDIRWYQKDACLLLLTWEKLYLSGTAVKIKPREAGREKRKK